MSSGNWAPRKDKYPTCHMNVGFLFTKSLLIFYFHISMKKRTCSLQAIWQNTQRPEFFLLYIMDKG